MKKLYEISDGSVLLIPSTATALLRKQLLESNASRLKLLSFDQYLEGSNNDSLSNNAQQMKLHQIMKELANKCVHFKDLCSTPSFEDEMFNFLNELHDYGITPDDLPEESSIYIELKMILSVLYLEDIPAKRRITNLHNIKHTENLIIAYQNYNLFESKCFDYLCEQGAKFLTFDQYTSHYEFYHAINQRQEVESVAQYIITHELDVSKVQLGACSEVYLPLIEQVFNRYKLPFTFIQTPLMNDINIKVRMLLDFILKPNLENTLQCLNNRCFSNFVPSNYIQALQLYQLTWDQSLPDLSVIEISEDVLSRRDVEKVQYLISKANHERVEIDKEINRLMSSISISDYLEVIDELLRKYTLVHEDNNKALIKLQTIFKDVFPFMSEHEDLIKLKAMFENLHNQASMRELNKIVVGPLDQLAFGDDYLFILGATQKDFPGFNGKSGVFDEVYLSKCGKYPSLEERYQHHLSMKMDKLNYAKNTIISYPLINYDGTVNESSLEIENTLKMNHIPFPLIQKEPILYKLTNISEDTAKALYVKEGEIKGSISSLEKYVNCPYAYFLKYGLRISEPIDPHLNNQMVGSLSHYILETLVNRYGKDYSKASAKLVSELIQEKLDEVKLIYPHLHFECIKQKEVMSIMNNLLQLDEIEKRSSLIPTHCERSFTHYIDITDMVKLKLNGFIDRIDENSTSFRIIDYKSSMKKLDATKVFSGTQLQLVTYAMIILQEMKKDPLGAFYYSLKNENISLPYGKIKRTKPTDWNEYTPSAQYNEQLKATRLNGWITSKNYEEMDNDGSTVVGLKSSSKGISATKIYDPKVLIIKIEEIMKKIIERILSGYIECTPNEDACLFCKYRPICRFNGSTIKNELLVEIPTNLVLGGDGDE